MGAPGGNYQHIETSPGMFGGLTAEASDKLARFVDTCDQFHLPLVNFVDQPGFVIGTESERRGTIRRGTRALFAVYQAICRIIGIVVNAAGIPPDRISFPHALAAATDTVSAFSP